MYLLRGMSPRLSSILLSISSDRDSNWNFMHFHNMINIFNNRTTSIRAVLRMAGQTSKKYDLALDEFIIDALSKKNMGYRHLHRLIQEEYRSISFETFNRHISHLKNSGWIEKDTKYAPYRLTDKCKQQLRLGTLVLASPKPKAIKPSTSAQLAINRIHAHILLLLFKLESSYEFATIEELEYFLSRFDLSTNSLPVFIAESDELHKSSNEIYKLKWMVESDDGKFSVNERKYVRSPHRIIDSISYICDFKGIKYPISRYRLDPFRKMGITQDEIKNTLSVLSNENILQKPVEYLGESIYLAVDIHLYDLLSQYSYLYYVCRSTLKVLWNLREPTIEEIQWMQKIEGDSKVTRFTARAKAKRTKHTYYERQRRLTDLIKKITEIKTEFTMEEKKHRKWMEKVHHIVPKAGIKEPTIKERIENEYQEVRANPKYQFIISEIEKFAFPNWFQRIKKKLR